MWSVGIEVFTVLSMFCTSVCLQLDFIEKIAFQGGMSVEKSSQYSRCFVVGLQWDFIEEMLFQGGMSVQKSSQYSRCSVPQCSGAAVLFEWSECSFRLPQHSFSGENAPFCSNSIVLVVRMLLSAVTARFEWSECTVLQPQHGFSGHNAPFWSHSMV